MPQKDPWATLGFVETKKGADFADLGFIETKAPAGPGAATPPSSTSDIIRNSPGYQLLQGIAQGTGQIGLGALQWMQDLPRQIREARTGRMEPSSVTPTPPWLEPQTATQSVGAAIPAIAGSTLLAAIPGGLPAQVAAGGIGSGLIAGTTGAGPGMTQVAGAMGMAGPALQRALNMLSPTLRKAAEERIAAALKPVGQEKKELARVIGDVAKQKPFAWSSEGLLKQFTDQAEIAAEAIDEAIDAFGAGRKIAAKPIAAKLNPLISALKIDGKFVTPESAAAAAQLRLVQREIKELGRVTQPYSRVTSSGIVPRVIQQQTVGARLESLRRLKQNYDQIVAGAQEHFFRALPPESRAAAAKQGFIKVSEGMMDALPELQALNRKYTIPATVRDILQRSEYRGITGPSPTIARVAELGGIAGGIVTGSVRPVAGAGILAVLVKFVDSTPFKLASANSRTRFANAIESGNIPAAMALMGQMSAQGSKE